MSVAYKNRRKRGGQVTDRKRKCMNCEEIVTSGHFVPPSFGEEGFFICKTKEEAQKDNPIF